MSTSTCGVCGQVLLPNMGHACSTVGAPQPSPRNFFDGVVVAMRQPAPPPSWSKLARRAGALGLQLTRDGRSATISTSEAEPVVQIAAGRFLDSDDRVLRRAVAAALEGLEIERAGR